MVTQEPLLEQVRDLMVRGAKRQIRFGDEDLTEMIAAGNVFMSTAHGRPMGMLAVNPEAPAPSLPDDAPQRVFMTGAAFAQGASPSAESARLVQAWKGTPAYTRRTLIAYAEDPWLERALAFALLSPVQTVVYYVLQFLGREAATWSSAGPASLRSATINELDAVAMLDAQSFNLLWHMTARDLHSLLFQGRMQLAFAHGHLIGYSATTLRGSIVYISRLAVHPDWQGQGIGRQLMVDALESGLEMGCTEAMLNTQSNNARGQRLYHSLGFRPTGAQFAVLTMDAP